MRSRAKTAGVVLLDIGNSRLKWALLRGRYRRGRRFDAQGALAWGRAKRTAALFRIFSACAPIAAVEVSNVAGRAAAQDVRAAARQAGLPPPAFLRTTHRAGGVRNAYPEPWRLGVDRWAALIGAHFEYPGRALCLVAVGTALTIDLVDAYGRHRGGSIIPGPALMIDSLLNGTAGIRRRADVRQSAPSLGRRPAPLFARNTRDAITGGALHAAAALIAEAMRQARSTLASSPRLIISGGAAKAVARLLRERHERGDELSLRGLAVLRCTLPLRSKAPLRSARRPLA